MTGAQPLRALRAARRHTGSENESAPAIAEPWSREWIYFTLTMGAWSFTPLLRRLIDYRSGAFNPVTVTSLLPFLMLLPFVFFCFKKERLARLSPLLRTLSYIWAATFAYGFLIAAAFGSFNAAAFELLQYLVPMLAGIWLAGQGLPVRETLRRLALIVLPCAAIVAAYGLMQWVSPPPWDVMWVDGSHFSAAGDAVPFGMRVFSTLNSPGPAADFFAVTMIFTLPFLRFRALWTWPLMAALGAALMLTMIREAWVGLIVGVTMYLVVSPRRLRAVPSLLIFAVLLAALVTTLPALLGSGANADVVSERLSTLTDVGHDASAIARQTEISDALSQGLANPLGAGLGNIGAAARLGSSAQSSLGSVLDSGYMARFLELGWLGCIGYIVVVVGGPLALLYQLAKRSRAAALPVDIKVCAAMAIAIATALAWSDAANDAHLGLDGLFFWLAIGLGSLALDPQRVAPAAGAQPPAVRRLQRSV
jgi:hypothetical protein